MSKDKLGLKPPVHSLNVVEMYLPNGMLFTISDFPEPTAREHLESHIGVILIPGTFGKPDTWVHNIEKTTTIRLPSGKELKLTPATKHRTLWFVYPGAGSQD